MPFPWWFCTHTFIFVTVTVGAATKPFAMFCNFVSVLAIASTSNKYHQHCEMMMMEKHV